MDGHGHGHGHGSRQGNGSGSGAASSIAVSAIPTRLQQQQQPQQPQQQQRDNRDSNEPTMAQLLAQSPARTHAHSDAAQLSNGGGGTGINSWRKGQGFKAWETELLRSSEVKRKADVAQLCACRH